jgi:hypothetical protein
MGDTTEAHEAILHGDLIVGGIPIALYNSVRGLEQAGGHLATPARIVVEQNNPLPRGPTTRIHIQCCELAALSLLITCTGVSSMRM